MVIEEGKLDLPDSEVSVFDSRSLSDASKILAFSSLIVSWGKLVIFHFQDSSCCHAVTRYQVGLQVHLGRDFPRAVHLLLLRQPGDRRPAGGRVGECCAWTAKNWQTGHRQQGMGKPKVAFETGNSSKVKTVHCGDEGGMDEEGMNLMAEDLC